MPLDLLEARASGARLVRLLVGLHTPVKKPAHGLDINMETVQISKHGKYF